MNIKRLLFAVLCGIAFHSFAFDYSFGCNDRKGQHMYIENQDEELPPCQESWLDSQEEPDGDYWFHEGERYAAEIGSIAWEKSKHIYPHDIKKQLLLYTIEIMALEKAIYQDHITSADSLEDAQELESGLILGLMGQRTIYDYDCGYESMTGLTSEETNKIKQRLKNAYMKRFHENRQLYAKDSAALFFADKVIQSDVLHSFVMEFKDHPEALRIVQQLSMMLAEIIILARNF